MRTEFRQYDWKMMILHFLGLDHIGHVEGPFSEKVPGKLKEMDSIVEEIYGIMNIWVCFRLKSNQCGHNNFNYYSE